MFLLSGSGFETAHVVDISNNTVVNEIQVPEDHHTFSMIFQLFCSELSTRSVAKFNVQEEALKLYLLARG